METFDEWNKNAQRHLQYCKEEPDYLEDKYPEYAERILLLIEAHRELRAALDEIRAASHPSKFVVQTKDSLNIFNMADKSLASVQVILTKEGI